MGKFLRATAFVMLVCLSIAVPAGIIVWSWHAAFGDKPSESFASDYHIFNHAAVHGHEMWYYSMPLDEFNSAQIECQLRRLNLETGEDVATGIRVKGYELQLIWLQNSLYIYRSESGNG